MKRSEAEHLIGASGHPNQASLRAGFFHARITESGRLYPPKTDMIRLEYPSRIMVKRSRNRQSRCLRCWICKRSPGDCKIRIVLNKTQIGFCLTQCTGC